MIVYLPLGNATLTRNIARATLFSRQFRKNSRLAGIALRWFTFKPIAP
jgi:hypothetical protein